MSAMQKGSLVETYEPFVGRKAVEEFTTGGSVERYFEERWQHATVAVLHGEIVGVAVVVGALLDLVWVKQALRSRGIGSRLMDSVERRAALEAPS